MSKLSKKLGKGDANLLGLMHSAIDIADQRLHIFAQWLNTPSFAESRPRKGADQTPPPQIEIINPIKF